MVDAEKDKTKGEEIQEEIQRIRMTLRSKETKPLEAACAEIVARAKNQGYETKGPVRIPTKILKITTRKSPCGEGSKTWDRFEMRIHKRVIDIHCPSSVVKEITNFRIDPGVDVNLIVWKQQPGMIQARQQNSAQFPFSELQKLLPQISESERQSVREQLLETLAKDMDPDSIQRIIENQNNPLIDQIDHGLNSNSNKMSVIDVVVQLETLINSKYSAQASNQNYKGLSKKIVQSLKTKHDQRLQIMGIKDQTQIEDFLQTFLFEKPRPGAPLAQESAGSAATTNNNQQNNPFAFPKPTTTTGANQRRPAGPQSRLPQQRFAAPGMFVPPTIEYTPGAINAFENKEQSANDGGAAAQSILGGQEFSLSANIIEGQQHQNQSNVQINYDPQSFLEQERPTIQQNNNQSQEEAKTNKAAASINFFSDSGAADLGLPNQLQLSNIGMNQDNQIINDEMDYFSQMALKATQQQNKLNQDFMIRQQQELNESRHQAQLDMIQQQNLGVYQQFTQQYSIQEEQSKGDQTNDQNQRLEFNDLSGNELQKLNQNQLPLINQQHIPNNQNDLSIEHQQDQLIPHQVQNNYSQFHLSNQNSNMGLVELNQSSNNSIFREEGRVYEAEGNLEQEEGQQKQNSDSDNNQQREQLDSQRFIQQESNDNQFQQQDDLNEQQFNDIPLIEELQASRAHSQNQDQRYQTEESPEQVNVYETMQFNQDSNTTQKMQDMSQSRNQSLPNFRLDNQSHIQAMGSNNNNYNQYQQTQPDLRSSTPSMKGFIQSFQSSRPPQSVASLNITNLEDSEALIRAYKKKKNELEEMKNVYYRIETDYFTEKQRALLLEEENQHMKVSLSKAEKSLREAQLRESRRDTDVLQKQLQLKAQEIQAYQNEVHNQKLENQKLREKLKDSMTRNRGGAGGSGSSLSHVSEESNQNTAFLSDQIQKLQADNTNLRYQLDQARGTISNMNEESNRRLRSLEEQKNQLINQLEQTIHQLKAKYDTDTVKLISERDTQSQVCRRLQEELSLKAKENEQLAKHLEEKSKREEHLLSEKAKLIEKSQNSSFVNLSGPQVENQSPQTQQDPGYIDYHNLSSNSSRSHQVEQRSINEVQVIRGDYFNNQIDEADKKSSAPPSQHNKQQINQFIPTQHSNQPMQQQQHNQTAQQQIGSQNFQQPQQRQHQQQIISQPLNQKQQQLPQQQQQRSAFSNSQSDAEDFFSSLSQNAQMKPPTQNNQTQPQQQIIRQQQPQQMRQALPQTFPQNSQIIQQQAELYNNQNIQMRQPLQQQTQITQKPPQQYQNQRQQPQIQQIQNQNQIQNAYNFTLDEISFEESFSIQQTQKNNFSAPIPQQQMQHSAKAQNYSAPQQQQYFQPQNNVDQQKQQPHLQQQQQQKQKNTVVNHQINKYFEDDTETDFIQQNQINANVIPNSLFD
ncbi:ribosomal protein s20 [Stylonychia lemnae]|uniref:Small ribosomal subunit protein uS10 n=1 Tax=Stylonychia lemnae TaxID=5949 RepID=A0A078AJ06_STYLE|nr:ribosomal protein s20 [Stylonychia lemnae]|eukprot:CDW80788.1 ribosomal protein s20 [Stylonychia lemnae]